MTGVGAEGGVGGAGGGGRVMDGVARPSILFCDGNMSDKLRVTIEEAFSVRETRQVQSYVCVCVCVFVAIEDLVRGRRDGYKVLDFCVVCAYIHICLW